MRKALIVTGTVALLGVGGFLYYNSRKNSSEEADSIIPGGGSPNASPSPNVVVNKSWTSGKFPLVQGMSKNNDVYNLQKALIALGGRPAELINNAGGADGSFGPATAAALQAAGYSTSVDQGTAYSISLASKNVSNAAFQIFNTSSIRGDLINAEATKNIDSVVNVLQRIKNVDAYSQTQFNLIGSNGIDWRGDNTRKTIVTKLLETFGSNASARAKLEAEFARIGLVKDLITQKWSLSGLGDIPLTTSIITVEPCLVNPLDDNNTNVIVPANVILGREVFRETGKVIVLTLDNRVIKAPIESVKQISK